MSKKHDQNDPAMDRFELTKILHKEQIYGRTDRGMDGVTR